MHGCGFGGQGGVGGGGGCGDGVKDLLLFLHRLFFLLRSTTLSLGLLVGLGGRVFAGQGHALVAVPQLVQLGGFVLAAAGAAVSEAGQRRAHLHALHRHRALDGLTKLEGGKKGRESEKTTLCSLLEMLHSIIHKLSLLFVSTKC